MLSEVTRARLANAWSCGGLHGLFGGRFGGWFLLALWLFLTYGGWGVVVIWAVIYLASVWVFVSDYGRRHGIEQWGWLK